MISSGSLNLFFLCCHLKTLVAAFFAMRNCSFVDEINKNKCKATGSKLVLRRKSKRQNAEAARTVGWRGEANNAYLLPLGGNSLG